MASTAKRMIYAGFALLLAALALSLAALYQVPWSHAARETLTLGRPLSEPLVLLLQRAGVNAEETVSVNLTVRLLEGCRGLRVLAADAVANTSAEHVLSPGSSLKLDSLSPTAAVYLEPLGGSCRAEVALAATGRSYPLRWLSLPALALMVAGSAALSLGAVLRLAGLEEE